MKGFKVICLECGKETVYSEDMETNNENISIYPSGYDGQITIECDCGKKIENEY